MSSLGLWEVMVAFSRANKKKHEEDVAREGRDWSRRQAERKLKLAEDRLRFDEKVYTTPKARSPEQIALDQARADKTASEADRAAVLAANEEENQIALRQYKAADQNYKAGRLALDRRMAPIKERGVTASAVLAEGRNRRENEAQPINFADRAARLELARRLADLKETGQLDASVLAGERGRRDDERLALARRLADLKEINQTDTSALAVDRNRRENDLHAMRKLALALGISQDVVDLNDSLNPDPSAGIRFDPATPPADREYQLLMLKHRQKVAELSRVLDLYKEMTVGQSRNSSTSKEREAAKAAVEKAQSEVSQSFEDIRKANEEYRITVATPAQAAAPAAPTVPFVAVEPPSPVAPATAPAAQIDPTEAQWLKFKAAAAKVGARNVREFLMERRAKETDPTRQAEWDFWIRYAINGK